MRLSWGAGRENAKSLWKRSSMKKETREEFLRRLYRHTLDITEFVCSELNRRNISRKKLAKKMRVFETHLDMLLDDLPADFRLSDLLRLADALSMDIDLSKVFVEKKKK